MSTNDQKYSRTNVGAMLEEAQLSIRERTETQGGLLHELEPAHCGGYRAIMFDNKEKGVTIAVRTELPPASQLRSQAPTSQEALSLLGALTLTLQGYGAEARLISGEQGLEAIMVSQRICDRALNADGLKQYLGQLQAIAEEVEPALSLNGQAQIEHVLVRVRPQYADLRQQETHEEAIVVPTFDEEARNRLMKQTQ